MKVMVFGSFDKLHDGHRNLFLQARALGDVIVVVARDSSIRRLKKREPRQSENERLENIEQEKTVTKAILGKEDDFFRVIEEEKPDILLLGYDQSTFSEKKIRKELVLRNLNVVIQRAAAFYPDIFKSNLLDK